MCRSDILLQGIDVRKLNYICMYVCINFLIPTNPPLFTRQRSLSTEFRKVFVKYLSHMICEKVALNVFQFGRKRDLESEYDDCEVGDENIQDEETQLDEYHNPPDEGGAEKSQDEKTQLREYHNPPDEGGAEDTQDDVTQLDEYRNPEGPESPYWDPSWILGIIIITINVPLPRYPLHTLFIFAYIKYGQAKAKAGLKEYIAKKMVFAHTMPTEHSRDSILNVKQPTTS